MDGMEFYGYAREDGTVGVRNHVALISVDALANRTVEGISKLVKNTVPITHPYGRLQFGEDLDLTFRTLIGTGSNPNVAAALIVGLEPSWTSIVAEGVSRSKKPVESVTIIGNGDHKALEKGARIAQRMVSEASEIRREPFHLSNIVVSIKCGASDTTSGMASNPAVGRAVDRIIDEGGTVIFGETSELAGAEHILARRAVNEEVREAFLKTVKDYIDFAVSKGVDILGSQPTAENIAGGLSTIEEKALGNIQKTGTKPIQGVLKPAERPKGRGLWFMDTSASAQEAVTLFAAAGAVVHLFPTGQGNVVGHPIEPVIKITANEITAERMPENIDVDVSDILRGKMSYDEAGELILDALLKTASGKLPSAEILGHNEFALTRFWKSM
ncbi:MAG: galactarate dehydratase [Candidatus Bathyarchaeota archaeon B26-2]|nr:MAG: galactarate dehydratase [Candidatus Bathyarchaeota archaeon B26-2]